MRYYEVLGLKPGAGVAEIKKSYRELAKKYHPDVCGDANAHERFVKLTEAYEILIDHLERKANTHQPFNRAAYYRAVQEQQRQREAAAKRKAEQAARMKYEEFINSDYYKTELYTHVLIDHFLFLLAVFLMFILPAIMTTMIGIEGLIGSIVVALVTSPLTFKPLMNFRKMNFGLAWDGIKFLSRNKKIAGFIFFAATVFLFFNAAFRTEISNMTFFMIFLVPPVLALVLCFSTNKKELRQHPFYYAFVIVPLIITLLLNLNYYVSFNAVTERYSYTVTEFTARKKGGGIETVSQTIHLPGGKYENCYALRLFYGTACKGNVVLMHFSRGILGLRTVKNFEFTYVQNEPEN